MRRLTWLIVVPSIAALVAALAALPFFPKHPEIDEKAIFETLRIDVRPLFSLGTFWGWYEHMLVGAAIAASVVAVLRHRDRPIVRLAWTCAALLLGGAFGAGGDAWSDFLCLSYAKSLAPDYHVSLFKVSEVMALGEFWPLWFSAGMCTAIALALGADITAWKRAGIGVVFSTVFVGIARYGADTVGDLERTVNTLTSHGAKVPVVVWSIPRLFAYDILIAIAVGLAFHLANAIVKDHGLRGLNGSIEGRFWGLGDAPTRIGSDSTCFLRLPRDPSVSEFHAQVQCDSGEHYVSAANGPIIVNGANVAQSWLSDGDIVTIGNCRLVYGPPNLKVALEARLEYALLDELGRRTELHEGPTVVGTASFERLDRGIRMVASGYGSVRVNGQSVQSAELKAGDSIKIDGETYRLVAGTPTRRT